MAAGRPLHARNYFYTVWESERFPDQANPFLKNQFLLSILGPPLPGGDDGGTVLANPAPSHRAQG